MLRYSFVLGQKIPFKIYSKACIKLEKGVKYKAEGRLNLGSKKGDAIVSASPVNLYFGSNSEITIGHSVCLGPGVNIIVKENAQLNIGNGTYFTSDIHIEAVRYISIGKNCAISWGVTILDSDHHSYSVDGKQSDPNGETFIGNNVWVGCNVTILKNTFIADGCIVAAGSVVKGEFPPNSMLAGNPARVIKNNISWS